MPKTGIFGLKSCYGQGERSGSQIAYLQPRVWFTQAEAQFELRKTTADETKYYHILAALDQSTVTRLLDLISAPPHDNKYLALKACLVDTFGLSKRERAARLLHTRPLGDSKPSVLMDEMLALLGDHPPCMLFEQLFLERLSEDISGCQDQGSPGVGQKG